MHQRQKIREKIASLLVEAATAAGDKVYTDRAKKIAPNLLPAIYVFTQRESSKYALENNSTLERDVTLTVYGLLERKTNLDDEADSLALEIESALSAYRDLDGHWHLLELKSTDIEIDDEGEKLLASLKLTYSISYDQPGAYR